MSHTIKVIALGFALLALCLIVGRVVGGPDQSSALTTAVKVFIPIWLIGAGINLWVGVTKAGYSVAEEAPIFLLVFAVPAGVAVLVWWQLSRG